MEQTSYINMKLLRACLDYERDFYLELSKTFEECLK